VADDLANLGTTWEDSDLQCSAEADPNHPILQHCIQKSRTVDFPLDGVIVRSTRQPMEEGGGLQDEGARERLVPPPGG